jgi:hypothetical protein
MLAISLVELGTEKYYIPFRQMRLSDAELGSLGLLIVYIAFFTHPPPAHLKDFLSSPVGHALALMGVLYTSVYVSLIVGVFLGIAYVMTAQSVTEYMDPTEQSAPKKEAAPQSSGVPPPAVTGALKALLQKGDTRLPQSAGKSETTKPPSVAPPKATPPAKIEHFASF